MAFLVTLKWLLNKMLRPQSGQWLTSSWRTAIVIPCIGRLGMLCALSSGPEVTLLLADIALSSVNDGGRIVSPARNPNSDGCPAAALDAGTDAVLEEVGGWRKHNGLSSPLRLGFHKAHAGQNDRMRKKKLSAGSLERPVHINRHAFARVHAPSDRGC